MKQFVSLTIEAVYHMAKTRLADLTGIAANCYTGLMADGVTFICPKCGGSMRLASGDLGREGPCAHCGETITTPTEAEIAALRGGPDWGDAREANGGA